MKARGVTRRLHRETLLRLDRNGPWLDDDDAAKGSDTCTCTCVGSGCPGTPTCGSCRTC